MEKETDTGVKMEVDVDTVTLVGRQLVKHNFERKIILPQDNYYYIVANYNGKVIDIFLEFFN